MPVILRVGTPADAAAAADLYLRARRAATGAIPSLVRDDGDVHRWFASHVVRDLELRLAEDEDHRLLGILVLDGEFVDQLYVEPTMTGRGIGTLLLDLAKRERPGGLRLWTFASSRRAQRFYESRDFVEIRRTAGNNEEGAPDILYAWRPKAVGPGRRGVVPGG